MKNQFAFQPATGCINAITVSKGTVVYYSSQRSVVYCAMVVLSNAYERINTCLLWDKMRETELPGQVFALIDFIGKKTFCLHILWRATEWWMEC